MMLRIACGSKNSSIIWYIFHASIYLELYFMPTERKRRKNHFLLCFFFHQVLCTSELSQTIREVCELLLREDINKRDFYYLSLSFFLFEDFNRMTISNPIPLDFYKSILKNQRPSPTTSKLYHTISQDYV
jgi:hypothetical protein